MNSVNGAQFFQCGGRGIILAQQEQEGGVPVVQMQNIQRTEEVFFNGGGDGGAEAGEFGGVGGKGAAQRVVAVNVVLFFFAVVVEKGRMIDDVVQRIRCGIGARADPVERGVVRMTCEGEVDGGDAGRAVEFVQKTVRRGNDGGLASLFGQCGRYIADDIADSADFTAGDPIVFGGNH